MDRGSFTGNRTRASSDPLQNDGHPFSGENWRKFVYHPLDKQGRQIRVLNLLPSHSFEADPACCLDTVNIEDESGDFSAISYVWGDQSDLHYIYLNGYRVRTGKNAYAVLRDIRLPDRPRRIWIDALCINQADILERGHQVQLMKDIYTMAREVLLCISDASLEVSKAIDLLMQLDEIAWRLVPDGSAPLYTSLIRAIDATNITEEKWHYLSIFCELDIWKRVWIVQELALGSQEGKAYIRLGTQQLSWEFIKRTTLYARFYLRTSVAYLSSSSLLDITLSIDCVALRSQMEEADGYFRYVQYVRMQGLLEVSDEKDRVFGFLGLFPALASKADYRDSIEIIFQNATAAILNSMGSLETITSWHSSWHSDGKIASWALDLRNAGLGPNGWQLVYSIFNACGSAGIEEPLQQRGPCLRIPGIKVASFHSADRFSAPIVDIFEFDAPERLAYRESLRDVAYEVASHRDGFENADHLKLREECQRLLLFDSWYDRKRFVKYNRLPSIRQYVEQNTLDLFAGIIQSTGKLGVDFDSPADIADVETSVLHYTSLTLSGRKIGLDSCGHLCIVPEATQAEDYVFILRGGNLPFVLRPVEDTRQELYRIIGPAYVHGIMDGEAVYGSPKRVSTGDPDAYDAAFEEVWLC